MSYIIKEKKTLAKKPHFAYWQNNGTLYVRCSGVKQSEFDSLLWNFKSHFQKAIWCKLSHAWKLPVSELQRVAIFAYQTFGPESLRVIDAPEQQTRQLELPLKWLPEKDEKCRRRRKL
jgi:hypothetical protein